MHSSAHFSLYNVLIDTFVNVLATGNIIILLNDVNMYYGWQK